MSEAKNVSSHAPDDGRGHAATDAPRTAPDDVRDHAADDAPRTAPRGAPGPAIVWFTGLPSSGKSTLARRVQAHFARTGRVSVVLDGDEVRDILGEHAYGAEDRERFYRALAELAALLAKQGLVVLVAATAPHRRDRDRARALMADGTFVEVWVDTPVEACEARDPKGLYAQARRDAANTLPGIGADYEAPLAPEVIADGGFDEAAAAAIECQLDRPAVEAPAADVDES